MTPSSPPPRSLTYLDYNATTPVLPSVAAAVTAALGDFGNPSSVHTAGRKARAAVEGAREAVAEMSGAPVQQVIFTSGGTEANVLALRGLAAAARCSAVLASGVEHASVLAEIPESARLAVDQDGRIDIQALEAELKHRAKPVLITVMLANNETGVIQPIDKVVALARAYGALVHCDAVQAAGKIPVDLKALGVDSVSLSAHKIGGLKGVGALVLRAGLEIAADLSGGGQERRRRAGTENVLGIIGFGAAARETKTLLAQAGRIADLRKSLEDAVLQTPAVQIFSSTVARLGNTSCFALKGVSSETQVMRLDLAGVAVSAGSACSSGKIAPSHVLLAMGMPAADATSAIRVSLGWETTADDISAFLKAWRPLVEQI